jgi:raffinose/stachyose/melibiose transport system permease protein
MSASFVGTARRTLLGLPRHLLLIVVSAMFAYPIVWTFLTSVKTPGEITSSPWGMPETIQFGNFVKAWSLIGMDRLLFNSIIVATTATIASTLIAFCAAYAIARSKSRVVRGVYIALLAALFFPIDVAMVALFVELRDMRLLNTYMGLILPYVAFNMPLSVLILSNGIRQIPSEILDSSKVDGANSWQALWLIVFPIAWPTVAAAAVLAFVGNWNEFLVALIVASNPSVQTLPVGIAVSINRQFPQYDLMFSGIVVSMIPMLIVFIALQRQFVAGITSGSVK